MPDETTQVAKLEESIRENPANRSYYQAALANARERIPFDALADIVAATPAPATCTVRPKNAITNLVRNGALSQTIEVDGIPYAGSYEDLLQDEGISVESNIAYHVEITSTGRAILDGMDARSRVDGLLARKPDFARDLMAVLELCASTPAGMPKRQIEKFLRDRPGALRIDERTGLETVSPSFYTTCLEDAGALAWANGLWNITEAGTAALGKRASNREGDSSAPRHAK